MVETVLLSGFKSHQWNLLLNFGYISKLSFQDPFPFFSPIRLICIPSKNKIGQTNLKFSMLRMNVKFLKFQSIFWLEIFRPFCQEFWICKPRYHNLILRRRKRKPSSTESTYDFLRRIVRKREHHESRLSPSSSGLIAVLFRLFGNWIFKTHFPYFLFGTPLNFKSLVLAVYEVEIQIISEMKILEKWKLKLRLSVYKWVN